ncbi:MAG TPA: transporter [Rickettsiales bacterium]|nr:transporter [Rickettsiales bacterium]
MRRASRDILKGGVAALLLSGFCASGWADSSTSSYWLLNPVPDDQMRDFSTDRPGKTHSSNTVDAGHFQIEADFINHTYDRYRTDGHFIHATSFMAPLVKAGVSHDVDVEALFMPLNIVHDKDLAANTTQTSRGFGDIWLGSKINLFGNDGGKQALAVLPFVKLPTAASGIGNGVAEYTLNIPYTLTLDETWSVTLEPGFGVFANRSDSNSHGDYNFAVNLNRPVFTKEVIAALEFYADHSGEHDIPNQYTLDPSLQWLVTPNLQLDIGMYIGLNRASPDLNPYTGISVRF